MKFRSVLFTAAIVVFTSGATNAAIVNYGDPITGGETEIFSNDVISDGQRGAIFTSPNADSGVFHSYLANNSTITFSYNFPLNCPNFFPTCPVVGATGGVWPSENYAQASTFQPSKFTYHFGDVFAAANLNGSDGFTSITNHSGEVIPISSWFSGLLQQVSNGAGGTVGKINYSVSAVPLPASVVMFGSAVAALFGFSYLSRQRKGAILQA